MCSCHFGRNPNRLLRWERGTLAKIPPKEKQTFKRHDCIRFRYRNNPNSEILASLIGGFFFACTLVHLHCKNHSVSEKRKMTHLF